MQWSNKHVYIHMYDFDQNRGARTSVHMNAIMF